MTTDQNNKIRDYAGEDTTEMLAYCESGEGGSFVSVPDFEEELNGQIVLVWRENLEFHQGMTDEDDHPLDDGTYETQEKVANAFVTALSEHFDSYAQVEGVYEGNYWVGDTTETVAVEIVLNMPDGWDTTLAAARRTLWPVEAELHNITDPGTFGSPYIFTRVLRALRD